MMSINRKYYDCLRDWLFIFIFPKLLRIIFLGAICWIDVIKNHISECEDDDDEYVPSIDTSFTSDDNHDYYDNIDFDSLSEMKKRVYESKGINIQTSSDDSSKGKN